MLKCTNSTLSTDFNYFTCYTIFEFWSLHSVYSAFPCLFKLHCKFFDGFRTLQQGFAVHFLSTEGFQTVGSKPFLEGFQTFPIRDVEKMTYYITFRAFHNGKILLKIFFKIFLQKDFIPFIRVSYRLYRVFHLPSRKGFRSFSKEYGNQGGKCQFLQCGIEIMQPNSTSVHLLTIV